MSNASICSTALPVLASPRHCSRMRTQRERLRATFETLAWRTALLTSVDRQCVQVKRAGEIKRPLKLSQYKNYCAFSAAGNRLGAQLFPYVPHLLLGVVERAGVVDCVVGGFDFFFFGELRRHAAGDFFAGFVEG